MPYNLIHWYSSWSPSRLSISRTFFSRRFRVLASLFLSPTKCAWSLVFGGPLISINAIMRPWYFILKKPSGIWPFVRGSSSFNSVWASSFRTSCATSPLLSQLLMAPSWSQVLTGKISLPIPLYLVNIFEKFLKDRGQELGTVTDFTLALVQ